jgi:hypothetical protein
VAARGRADARDLDRALVRPAAELCAGAVGRLSFNSP